MFKNSVIALISTVIFASAAQAHDFKLGNIHIDHPYASPTMPQQATGGAYFGLENNGKVDDKLVKVKSAVAKSVQIHSMEISNEVMKMREVPQIDLKAGSKISMKPGGGYHIMLMGLKQPLKAGEKFSLTLYFEKAGKIDVTVNVEANGSDSKETNHQH